MLVSFLQLCRGFDLSRGTLRPPRHPCHPPPPHHPHNIFVPLDRYQQIPVHTLVQYLLPSNDSGSHHLVPKSKEQERATKTLLGKIFDATGRKREMINLNGLCVEHPQAQSFLETVAAGDRRDDEVGRLPQLVLRRLWLRRCVCWSVGRYVGRSTVPSV